MIETDEERERFIEKARSLTDEETVEMYMRLDDHGKGGAKVIILSHWERMLEERMEEMRNGAKAYAGRTGKK